MLNVKHFVVMGVSGCGKSTIAALLAKRIGATMIEADELHGQANIEKMQCGDALTDEDRWPWLARVSEVMHKTPTPVVVSCSALRRVYRQCLLDNSGVPIGFIHLHTSREVIEHRMSARAGHFMPVSLLDSQLQLLEPLEGDEFGVIVDIAQTVEQVVEDSIRFVNGCSES